MSDHEKVNSKTSDGSPLLLREAVPNDIGALCSLENECFSTPWSEKAFSDFLSRSDAGAVVAVCMGKIVGYAGYYVSFGICEITDIAVAAGFRRKGVGKALLGYISDFPEIDRIQLELRESNKTAYNFYKNLGFTEDGKRPNFYSHPREDAVLMSKSVLKREN